MNIIAKIKKEVRTSKYLICVCQLRIILRVELIHMSILPSTLQSDFMYPLKHG